MNEQELKDAISDMQECLVIIGKANMKLNNILTQRKADMQKKLDDAYQKGLEDGKKAFDLLDAERDSEYQRGLNDAWDASKKLAMMDTETSEDVTGYFGLFRIMENLTPGEAISKLRAYEEEKKSKIRFGDEVVVYDKHKGLVVSHENDDCDNIWVLIAKYSTPQKVNKRNVSKTGRHFDIESILKEQSE